MKVSIIIPVYNVETYLNQCIDSIIQQSHKDLEIILVDDSSMDSSPDNCNEYATPDDRIKVIHKPNGVVSSARNKGLTIAIGQYVMFVDSGDYLDLDIVDILVSAYMKMDQTWLFVATHWFHVDSIPILIMRMFFSRISKQYVLIFRKTIQWDLLTLPTINYIRKI